MCVFFPFRMASPLINHNTKIVREIRLIYHIAIYCVVADILHLPGHFADSATENTKQSNDFYT